MELLEFTRWIHALIGIMCLLGGMIALISPKKRGRHSQSGLLFLMTLCLIYFAILPNMIVKRNLFMFVIGWLAIAAGIEGWRALLRWKKKAYLSSKLGRLYRKWT